MLMFRGAERHLKNSSGETADQVAITVGNLQIASMIEGFPEDDVGVCILNYQKSSIFFA